MEETVLGCSSSRWAPQILQVLGFSVLGFRLEVLSFRLFWVESKVFRVDW